MGSYPVLPQTPGDRGVARTTIIAVAVGVPKAAAP
jgi:hypothetical protein